MWEGNELVWREERCRKTVSWCVLVFYEKKSSARVKYVEAKKLQKLRAIEVYMPPRAASASICCTIELTAVSRAIVSEWK
jgi:hypothetical protein